MFRTRLTGVAALAIALCGQLPAFAGLDIDVPGNACRPRKSDVSKIQFGTMSTINEATSSATVVCPVHYQDNPQGSNPNIFRIRMIDRSTSANISCKVMSFHDLEPGMLFQVTVNSSGSSSSQIERTVTLDPNFGAMFTMTCTLPASSSSSNRSEIVSYKLEQT